jgi:magnesium transporter
MIRILQYTPRTGLDVHYPIDRLPQALRDKKGLLWLDFSGEADATCEPILRQVFGFHPLAVDDALQETHTPKVDDWGDYIYLVLNSIEYGGHLDAEGLHMHELDVFAGRNFIVTHHDQPLAVLDHAWDVCQRDFRHTQNGADHLLYRIVDFLVAGYMPVVEKIDEELDDIEDQVFNKPTRDTLEQIFALKRTLLSMRRVITPQREVLNKLARDDYRVIDPHDRIFFRDVYDHLVRLQDLNESMRDLVGGSLDTYLSVINNRMNDVMKTLTAVTTLFMPISFIAGFFGMNFFAPSAHMVRWTSTPAFYVMLAFTLLTPLTMFLWMRRRTWV